jgi:serine/threonine protein kinase
MQVPQLKDTETLCKGTFGTVSRALLSGIPVAVKSYNRGEEDRLDGVNFDSIKEIALLKSMRHPNVLNYLHAFFDGDGSPQLITELAATSLRIFLAQRIENFEEGVKPLPMKAVKALGIDLFSGLAYLHAAGIIHRDIKPDNLLLFRTARNTLTLKVADLGSSMLFSGPIIRNDELRTEPVTTMTYRPPESCMLLLHAQTSAMDVWSAGLVLSEILNDCGPHFCDIKSNKHLLFRICELLGTPTPDNGLMPSYYRDREGRPCPARPCPTGNVSYQPCSSPSYRLVDPCNRRLPVWFRDLIDALVQLEPARRPTARWASSVLLDSLNSAAGLPERSVPQTSFYGPLAARTFPLPAVHVRGEVEGDEAPRLERRALMGSWLFQGTVQLRSDYSRRVFHVAIMLLDSLMSRGEFVRTYMRQCERVMAGACAAIICIASKLCGSKHHTPSGLRALYASVASSTNIAWPMGHWLYNPEPKAVCQVELHLLSLCEFVVWVPIPLEYESHRFPKDASPRDVYALEGIIDGLLCYSECNGCTAEDVVLAALWIHESGDSNVNACPAPRLHRLISAHRESSERHRGGVVSVYYSATLRIK